MNRVDFMNQLESLLYDVSESEKAEAIQYYNDYFDDAGVENESEVMNELGSPEKVAVIIKEGLGIKAESKMNAADQSASDKQQNVNQGYGNNQGQNNNQGFAYNQRQTNNQGQGNNQGYQNNQGFQNNQGYTNNQGYNQNSQSYGNVAPRSGASIALLLIIGVITFPVWFPLLMAVLGVVFGVVMSLFGLVVGFGIAGIALVITSVILFGFSLVKLVVSPIGGICLIGVSLLLCGIALLMCLLAWAIAFKIIPVIVRAVIHVCQIPFQPRGGYAV